MGEKEKFDFAWEGRMSGFCSFVCVCSVEGTSYVLKTSRLFVVVVVMFLQWRRVVDVDRL